MPRVGSSTRRALVNVQDFPVSHGRAFDFVVRGGKSVIITGFPIRSGEVLPVSFADGFSRKALAKMQQSRSVPAKPGSLAAVLQARPRSFESSIEASQLTAQ